MEDASQHKTEFPLSKPNLISWFEPDSLFPDQLILEKTEVASYHSTVAKLELLSHMKQGEELRVLIPQELDKAEISDTRSSSSSAMCSLRNMYVSPKDIGKSGIESSCKCAQLAQKKIELYILAACRRGLCVLIQY
ncbi:hypothetical protein JRQ81_012164 [Phrynocephalus forsythii]|uniref:Uncharacterized protein n=1 Tax=Phrynocephalus forsythii TaxID=171643 RepID=A0A9Q0X5F8_9SAUR|nr:hypothetical protein JRQ81_012164 [Phrynocephalus forsythii]